MKIHVIGGSGGLAPGHMLTSFLVNDHLAMDAGSIAEALSIEQQAQVDHILLTHSHLDHTGTLPFMVDNIFGMRQQPVLVHAPEETIRSVQQHLFNDDIWPNFAVLPNASEPVMRFCALPDETEARFGELTVTAVRVNHIVPAVGYLIADQDCCVAFSGDTAPTERIWELARQRGDLKAVFIEASFPNRLQQIADVSGHLTPRTFGQEVAKLGRQLPVYAYHIKPRFQDEIVEELSQLGLEQLEVCVAGRSYKLS